MANESEALTLMKKLLEVLQTNRSVNHDELARYQAIEITELEKLIAFHLIYVEQ